MRTIFAIVLALTLASPVALAADRGGDSARALLDRISKEGGREVIWDLWEHEAYFDRVTTMIESGDPSWLKVAAALRPFSDAGASLSLDYAVARALPKAPSRVLALVGHGFSIEDICTSPFIEPDAGVAEAYEQKALAALATVQAPALAPIAAKCSERVRLPGGS